MQSSFVTNFLTQGSAGWKQRHPSLFQPTLISPPFLPHSHTYLYHLSQYLILQPSVLASSSILTSNLHPYPITSSIYNPFKIKTHSHLEPCLAPWISLSSLLPWTSLTTWTLSTTYLLTILTSLFSYHHLHHPNFFHAPPPIPLPPNHQNYSSIVS